MRMEQFPVDLINGGIAAAEPDDFRRCAPDLVPVGKVGILRDNDQILGLGVFPDCQVVHLVKFELPDMNRVRELVGQQADKTMAEVLVKKESHAVAATR